MANTIPSMRHARSRPAISSQDSSHANEEAVYVYNISILWSGSHLANHFCPSEWGTGTNHIRSYRSETAHLNFTRLHGNSSRNRGDGKVSCPRQDIPHPSLFAFRSFESLRCQLSNIHTPIREKLGRKLSQIAASNTRPECCTKLRTESGNVRSNEISANEWSRAEETSPTETEHSL